MRRGDFEYLVRQYLDGELLPRGFRLTPQPPADWIDDKPAVVYEANPDEFGERYPALDGRASGNIRCVDLWVHLEPSTGEITSELDGTSIETLTVRFGLTDPAESKPMLRDTASQLTRLAWRIAAILDAARRG